MSIYPLAKSCVLNTVPVAFNCDHNLHWGRLYEAEDVDIEWHSMFIHIVVYSLLTPRKCLMRVKLRSYWRSWRRYRDLPWTRWNRYWRTLDGTVPTGMIFAGRPKKSRAYKYHFMLI